MSPLDLEYASEAEARSADYKRREELAEVYTVTVLSKAAALERTGLDQDMVDERTFHVRGSAGDIYTVQLIAGEEDDDLPWVSCTCPNGMNRGSQPSCYHSAAVLLRHLRAKI